MQERFEFNGNNSYPEPNLSTSFLQCSELYYFHVLCDTTIKASKVMMDSVKKRYTSDSI